MKVQEAVEHFFHGTQVGIGLLRRVVTTVVNGCPCTGGAEVLKYDNGQLRLVSQCFLEHLDVALSYEDPRL